MVFAYYVFIWLTGSFGFYSFLAAILSTVIPIYHDYKKYRERKQSLGEVNWKTDFLAREAKAMVAGEGASVIGEIFGIGLRGWYLFH